VNRSLGFADAYPFTLAPKVIDKPRFGHKMIASAGTWSEPMPKQFSEPTADSSADADATPAAAIITDGKTTDPTPTGSGWNGSCLMAITASNPLAVSKLRHRERSIR
jgi:hypothetical protein